MIFKALGRIGHYLGLLVLGLAVFAIFDLVSGKGLLLRFPGSILLGLLIGMVGAAALGHLLKLGRKRNSLQ
jgi:hypothetical protein